MNIQKEESEFIISIVKGKMEFSQRYYKEAVECMDAQGLDTSSNDKVRNFLIDQAISNAIQSK